MPGDSARPPQVQRGRGVLRLRPVPGDVRLPETVKKSLRWNGSIQPGNRPEELESAEKQATAGAEIRLGLA
jgi:hypothetical protein